MQEKYVVSLPLAQRMKELGFKQESDFNWKIHKHGLPTLLSIETADNICCTNFREEHVDAVSAYHVGELGDMLFRIIQHTFQCAEDWIVMPNETDEFFARTEADARAKCLIDLAERKRINPINM